MVHVWSMCGPRVALAYLVYWSREGPGVASGLPMKIRIFVIPTMLVLRRVSFVPQAPKGFPSMLKVLRTGSKVVNKMS